MFSPILISSSVALLSSLAVRAASIDLGKPLPITGTVKYNVSSEHQHLFGPRSGSGIGKRTCASYNTAAEGTAAAMQTMYYNTGGYYQGGSGGGSAWTDVNGAEDLINLSLFNSFTTYSSVPEAINAHYYSQLSTSGAYDDALWGAIANFRECDFNAFLGVSTSTCTSRAIALYNVVVSAWDSTCNGGVWWSSAKTYKNAITNELFLYVSAIGYLKTGQSVFLSNAELAWAWIHGSGMQNSAGLYNDGLTSACANNGQTEWTYNQIVVSSGLGALYVATGSTNATLLTYAETSIDATIANFESGGILKESCDNAAGTTTCDADQQLFKGLFMKHLQYYLDYVNSSDKVAKYTGFINAQGSGVVHYATGAGYDVGSVWYAPNAGGSIFSPKTQASGLACLNAASKYYTC